MDSREAERWNDMLRPFKDLPGAAFHFATMLWVLRKMLEFKNGKQGVISVLTDLIDALFPYTYYYHAGLRFYRLKLEGQLMAQYDPTEALLAVDPTWSAFRYSEGDDYIIDFYMPEFPNKLGEKLKQVRERMHLSPEQFATHVRAKDGAAIRSYEAEKADPPVSILYAYVNLAGVPLENFLDDDRELWTEHLQA